MKLCVIGTGYVGLVSGTCFADLGNTVICVDNNAEKIDSLNTGKLPFYEPGLSEKIERNQTLGRLTFTTDITQAVCDSDIIFSAVGTPSKPDGDADLTSVYQVVESVADTIIQNHLSNKIYVTKSTVPVGTGRNIMDLFARKGLPADQVTVVSNPEFLREGTSVYDFFHPDRVVIGGDNEAALSVIETLYSSLYRLKNPVIKTSLETAELSKYAANTFLATKVSFINEMANLCEKVGANIQEVAKIMGMDGRISRYFLHPGPGYGGSCFPKDTKALIHLSRMVGQELKLVSATESVNDLQKRKPIDVLTHFLGDLSGKTVTLLGLSFKPNTDDIRDSASVAVIDNLMQANCQVNVYDPAAMDNGKQRYGDHVYFATDIMDAVTDADAVILMTEWNEFRKLDLKAIKSVMKGTVFLDFRNIYSMDVLRSAGFNGYVLGSGNLGDITKK